MTKLSISCFGAASPILPAGCRIFCARRSRRATSPLLLRFPPRPARRLPRSHASSKPHCSRAGRSAPKAGGKHAAPMSGSSSGMPGYECCDGRTSGTGTVQSKNAVLGHFRQPACGSGFLPAVHLCARLPATRQWRRHAAVEKRRRLCWPGGMVAAHRRDAGHGADRSGSRHRHAADRHHFARERPRRARPHPRISAGS